MKLITLEKWAEAHLDPVPSPATLRMWARTNRFDPPAQKVGRCYRVDEHARYCEPEVPVELPDDGSLHSRIMRARYGAATKESRIERPAA